jgi:hypothetical protein
MARLPSGTLPCNGGGAGRGDEEPADNTGEAEPAEVVRVDGRGPGTERKVARAWLSAPVPATFRGYRAERWHVAPSQQLLNRTGVGVKSGFLAKGGNAWYFVELPGMTCVLPRYQETPAAPHPPQSGTLPASCPIAQSDGGFSACGATRRPPQTRRPAHLRALRR